MLFYDCIEALQNAQAYRLDILGRNEVRLGVSEMHSSLPCGTMLLYSGHVYYRQSGSKRGTGTAVMLTSSETNIRENIRLDAAAQCQTPKKIYDGEKEEGFYK